MIQPRTKAADLPNAQKIEVVEGQLPAVRRINPAELHVPDLGIAESRSLIGRLKRLRDRGKIACINHLLVFVIVPVIGVQIVDLQTLSDRIGVVALKRLHRHMFGADHRAIRPDQLPSGNVGHIGQGFAQTLLCQPK